MDQYDFDDMDQTSEPNSVIDESGVPIENAVLRRQFIQLRDRNAELEQENARLITLAADALGTDPEYHSAGCVEALVQYHQTVKEDVERLSAALESKQQEVNKAMEMFFKAQGENERIKNFIIQINADCNIALQSDVLNHKSRNWINKIDGHAKVALKEVDGGKD